MKRVLSLALAVILLACGGALAALAGDVRRSQNALADDEMRFQSASAPQKPASVSTLLPAGAVRRALGVDDDLDYRHALRSFRLTRPLEYSGYNSQILLARGFAEAELTEIVFTEADARRRSHAANLLGVLALVEARERPQQLRGASLSKAAGRFETSARLDARNDDAKYNLELTLRQLREDEHQRGEGGGRTGGNESPGAGLSGSGRGY